MGKTTGFLEFSRETQNDRPVEQRVKDWDELHLSRDEERCRRQGARCMDCGVPFCQSSYGCPVANLIPEWNDLIFYGRWQEAFERLRQTNNFPEYTGRVCPAPCETACVLGITDPAVTIKDNECSIADRAYAEGWMQPRLPSQRTGWRVAIVGSGPAGLAAADQLNQAGHSVTVYERDDRIGGLLMYGIPNMKLDKQLVERRNAIMAEEGIVFRTGVDVGHTTPVSDITDTSDAVLLTLGATRPRDLPVPGRTLTGVHFAMDFLTGAAKTLLDGKTSADEAGRLAVDAADKNVIVIGGGDTGNDCIGTSIRQGCRSVVNFELMPPPPQQRTADMPWPTWPNLYTSDYGHQEAEGLFGRDPREFSILTKEFLGDEQGRLTGVRTVRVEWSKPPDGAPSMQEIPGSEQVWEAELVLLALGFTGPERYLLEQLEVPVDQRGSIDAEYGRFVTAQPGIYAAGDARRGQSLVVWAINEGRAAAREIDRDLMGDTELP